MIGPFKHGILALCGMNLILDISLFYGQTLGKYSQKPS